MLWFFLFIAWIWLLVSVYADIFRSPDLSGPAKALWVVAVLVLPYLGVLVYLVARGGSMHERSTERAAAAQRSVDTYIRETAGRPSTADELGKLARLRDEGVLTDEEFRAQKSRLLTA
ncbi:SHOCT domain-containing protein [Nitriliruptoraceae bacterium ZYF776]|nr:SHOCT domain-containing protein [Profundirhabdus halotolerans]